MKKRQGSGIRDQGSVTDCPRFNQARMLIEAGSLL